MAALARQLHLQLCSYVSEQQTLKPTVLTPELLVRLSAAFGQVVLIMQELTCDKEEVIGFPTLFTFVTSGAVVIAQLIGETVEGPIPVAPAFLDEAGKIEEELATMRTECGKWSKLIARWLGDQSSFRMKSRKRILDAADTLLFLVSSELESPQVDAVAVCLGSIGPLFHEIRTENVDAMSAGNHCLLTSAVHDSTGASAQ